MYVQWECQQHGQWCLNMPNYKITISLDQTIIGSKPTLKVEINPPNAPPLLVLKMLNATEAKIINDGIESERQLAMQEQLIKRETK